MLGESGEVIRCSLRGKFKKDFELKEDKLYLLDIATVGDYVEYELNKDGTGVINKIDLRKNYLSRKAPRIKGASTRGERLEQVIASNFDNLIVVSSWDKPQFNNRLIDRLIVAGESSHVNMIIVINKIDLDKSNQVKKWVKLYKDIGYTTIETSVTNKIGISEFKNLLSGNVSMLWGQSGVGKSSLLNQMYQSLDLKIGEISTYSSKGKHTTVTSLMIKIDENTFIIDTPGIREIDPYGIRKEDLGHYFKEFENYMNDCRFNTCTHHHEPDCAVIEALRNGFINVERYQSYLNILDTIESDMNF